MNAIREEDSRNLIIGEFEKKPKTYNLESIKQKPLVQEESQLEKGKEEPERVEVRQRSFRVSNDPYEQSHQLNSGKGLLIFKKEELKGNILNNQIEN